MRTLARLVLVTITGANTGCNIVLPSWITISHEVGSSDDIVNPPHLPPPENPQVDPDVLTAEQQSRKDEADAYTADFIYKGRPIEKTVQGYSGMLYDYIKVPPLDIEVPDVFSLLPSDPGDGIQLGLTEVQRYPELWGPIDTTVFVRPDFSKYIMDPAGATSIQDWVANDQIPGIPDGEKRLYAGLDILEPNRGIVARINTFTPEVEKGSFSVVELAVACPTEGAREEMIGIMLMMDWANHDVPPQLSVESEWWREMNGVKEGGFGITTRHFEQLEVRSTDMGAPLDYEHISVPGGKQFEHVLYMIMSPNGDWWLGYNEGYIGKYPASMFKTLHNGACRAHVYAEVYNPHPELGWVRTTMGSGEFPNAPPGHVASISQIRYFDTNWWPTAPTNDDSALWSKPYDPVCYQRRPLEDQGIMGPTMKFGGPGGKDPVCAQKKPMP